MQNYGRLPLRTKFTVGVIPDLHDSPGLSKRRIKWMAKYFTDVQPDHIIQIGDIADFESLCSYIKNETYEGKMKPGFQQDLESLGIALQIFNRHYKPKKRVGKHITLGNHEERIWTFENNNPEIHCMMSNAFLTTLEHYGWTWSPFGEYYTYGGVDFVHAPLNAMRRPMGGVHVLAAAGRESLHDLVFGHTHKAGSLVIPKLGHDRKLTVVNVGCALEWGHVQEYAKLAQTGWWWGVTLINILGGRIVSVNQKSMLELKKDYGP